MTSTPQGNHTPTPLNRRAIVGYSALFAVVAAIVIFLLSQWLTDLLASYESWHSPTTSDAAVLDSNALSNSNAVHNVTWIAAQSVLGLVLVQLVRRRLPERTHQHMGSRPARTLICVGVFVVALYASRLVSRALDAPSRYRELTQLTTTADWLEVVRTLFAGAAEEPFFSALPILLLLWAATRWTLPRWTVPAVIAVSATARGVLHLYQGWPLMLDAMIWGAVAVYFYYRYRSLLGLIIGHTLANVFITINNTGHTQLNWIVLPVMIAAVAAFFALVPNTPGDELPRPLPVLFRTTPPPVNTH